VALLSSILVLLVLCFTHSQAIKGLCYYGPIKGLFWSHVTVFVLLTLGGSWPVEDPYLLISRFLSLFYFSFFALLGVYRRLWDHLLS